MVKILLWILNNARLLSVIPAANIAESAACPVGGVELGNE